MVMFDKTARQLREENPELKGNIRDYATNELICLSNMENLNAAFIEQEIPQSERLMKLNQIAIHQMQILETGGKKPQTSKITLRKINKGFPICEAHPKSFCLTFKVHLPLIV